MPENIDTTTANGILFFHFFGAIAQFARELIRERTVAGLASARVRGRLGGRPRTRREDSSLSDLAVRRPKQHGQRHLRDARHLEIDALPLCGYGVRVTLMQFDRYVTVASRGAPNG